MASGAELSRYLFAFASQILIQRAAELWKQLCQPNTLLLIGIDQFSSYSS